MTRKAAAPAAPRADRLRPIFAAQEGGRCGVTRKLGSGTAGHCHAQCKASCARFPRLARPVRDRCVSAGDLGLPEPAETGTSFAENALIKARAARKALGCPRSRTTAGCASMRWAAGRASIPRTGPSGSGSRAVRGATGTWRWARSGRCGPIEGRVEGHLTWPPRGTLGFGYDPVFVPTGGEQTFAEIAPEAKHAVSHRADAFAKLVAAVF
jgi:XTP/dITP diphosphohydrolase